MRILLPDESATLRLGALLAEVLPVRGLVFLRGELGAGKTTLVRGLLRALGYQGAVKSPTYSLVEEYRLEDRYVAHFDLYRLRGADELEGLGIHDYFDGPILDVVEWPERARSVLPAPDLELLLRHAGAWRSGDVAGATALMGRIGSALQDISGFDAQTKTFIISSG